MSAAPAVLDAQRVEPARRRLAFDGAALATLAMLASGVLAYAFLVLCAQTLGKAAYGGQLAVFWATLFLVVVILFRPLEQTLSRTIADRLTRGEEVRTVLWAVVAIYLALTTAVVGVGVLAHAPLVDRAVSAALFVGLYALLPEPHLGRIAVAFLAASFTGLVLLVAAFHARRAVP